MEKDAAKDFIYILFIFINILFVYFNRDNLSVLGIGQAESTQQIGEEASSLSTLFSVSMYVAKYILLSFVIRYFYRKYKINHSNFT